MKPFGLTSNIGCGKSTVRSLLAAYPDVLAFDSDCMAKEFLSSEACREDVVAILGDNIFDSQVMDFRAVAKIIFADLQKKKQIEALIHPLVWKAIEEKITEAGDNVIPIVESALLYEIRWQNRFTGMIVATCNPKEQYRRLSENRNMNEKTIQERITQQLPQEEKEKQADFVIRTDCNMSELEERVAILYAQLKQWKGT